jgi:hypothetical protein
MVRTDSSDEACEGVGDGNRSVLVETVTLQPSSNDSGRNGSAREEPRLLRTVLRDGCRLPGAGSYVTSGKASDLSKR